MTDDERGVFVQRALVDPELRDAMAEQARSSTLGPGDGQEAAP